MASDPTTRAPDFRRSLTTLRQDWEGCVRCPLGERRTAVGGAFVFGERVPQLSTHGTIMFVGEGPGQDEEEHGRPFVGKTGRFLRKLLMMLGLEEYYLTNAVACRSCAEVLDAQQQPIMRKNWKTKQMEVLYRDEPPTPPQCNACRPRLYEEIYLVDPILIVGLGAKACEALQKQHLTITRDRGDGRIISIPGASFTANVTKDKKWRRKLHGAWITPTAQNVVDYHFVPTLHPSYVMRKLADQGPDSPFRQFVKDIKKAIVTYEEYCRMTFGEAPTHRTSLDPDEMLAQFDED